MTTSRILAAVLVVVSGAAPAAAERIVQELFEGSETVLRLGRTDDLQLTAPTEHALATDLPHTGSQCERMRLRIRGGRFAFIEYPIAGARIIDELLVTVWVNADRPGTQLCARVVLPRQPDGETGRPVTVVLRGDEYRSHGQWRKLGLVDLPDKLQHAKTRMQAENAAAGRPGSVDVRGAYVDRILLDAHSGVGDVTVSVDDLFYGPVAAPGRSLAAQPQPAVAHNDAGEAVPTHVPEIADARQKQQPALAGGQLTVGGKPFFLRGIRRTNAPGDRLKEMNFNAVVQRWPVPDAFAAQANALGLRTIVDLSGPLDFVAQRTTDDFSIRTRNVVADELDFRDDHLAYLVGNHLAPPELAAVGHLVDSIRTRDPNRRRPITGSVDAGLMAFSQRLDMVGVQRYPLAGTLPLTDYQQWLTSRRLLGRPELLYWADVQTHPDDRYLKLVGGAGTDVFEQPIGPLPEQITLTACANLAAGYKGLVYSSDYALSDALQGRDRALQVALLNYKTNLVQPFLTGDKAPVAVKTSRHDVRAVVFQHDLGALVLAYHVDPHSAYSVGQAAVNDLQISVENVPESAQAFMVSLGKVSSLRRKSGLLGVRLIIPEFDTAAFVVMTTNHNLLETYQQLVQQVSGRTAPMQQELAEITLAKAEANFAQLGAFHPNPGRAADLLAQSRAMLTQSRNDALNLPRQAYDHATRARRLARQVQHELWLEFTRDIDSPVDDPFAVSPYTLVQSRQFRAALRQATFTENLIPSGDFNAGPLDPYGWEYEAASVDAIQETEIGPQLVDDELATGDAVSYCLELTATPTAQPPPKLAENTRVRMLSPVVDVRAGQVVRVRGRVRLPAPVAGSVDGVEIWDSLGGRALARRFTTAGGWQEFVWYRPVNADGQVRVHMCLTGFGRAQFDDLRIETTDNAQVPLAGRPAGVLR